MTYRAHTYPILRSTLTLASLLAVAAACDSEKPCEGQDCSADASSQPDSATPPVDAAAIDAPSGAPVDQLDCAGLSPAATVIVDARGATPSAVSVRVGEVVRVEAGAEHSHWDTGGAWSIGGTSCLRFNQVATYTSYCYFHGDEPRGTITVMP